MAGRLEIADVYTAYDQADVLQGVSLVVEAGSITCLLGSNGSGKTTLIRSILGLTPPRAGRIVFDGSDITRLPTHKVVAAGIACIPEGRKVFPKLTVEENLRVGAYQERSEAVTRARIAEIYDIFPRLAERRAQIAGTMSGGEQAMVSIGRGLMRAPKLLLIDEPSLGLVPHPGQGKLQHHPPDQRARHHGLPGRAERAPDARHLALRLCAVERPRGRRAARRRNLPTATRCARPISARALWNAGDTCAASLMHLDAGLLHDPAPIGELGADEQAELGGSTTCRLDGQVSQMPHARVALPAPC